MKTVLVSVLVCVGLISSACVMGSGGVRAGTLTQDQIRTQATGLGATHGSHLVQSRASCEPDRADAVWGPHEELLGYSCYAASQGAS
jgi:hypothetical protein